MSIGVVLNVLGCRHLWSCLDYLLLHFSGQCYSILTDFDDDSLVSMSSKARKTACAF